MYDWYRNIQNVIDEIDACIKNHDDEALTLSRLAKVLGYSEFYVSRKFSEISGMLLRDYMRYRRLAFALRELRDTERGILDIALDYGFSSHEAFTRAFREAYGITPSEYRKKPVPVVLRTVLRPFDYAATGYELDTAPGRVFYFYHDCKQFWKYVRPVHKINKA